MTEQFANQGVITLGALCAPGDATLSLVGAYAGLPTTGTSRLKIDAEIFILTAGSGATRAVLRGQEGTQATSHAVGATVTQSLTAGALAQYKTDVLAAAATAVPPIPPFAVSVANAAALTALAVTPFLVGAFAYLQSRTTIWTYQPGDATAADGWHIPAQGGGNWVYQSAGNPTAAAAQVTWNINASTGSDDATGLTSGAALQTKCELMRRWGTWSPRLNGVNVVINYYAADTVPDTGFFTPLFVNGATLQHNGIAPSNSFTGSLLVVTAKNLTAAPANGLRSTFTTTTGAIAVGQILTNTTKANSQARVVKSLGGGVWALSQPLQAWFPGAFPATNVDTWANGDVIVGTTPLALDIAAVGGVLGSFNLSTFASAHAAVGIEFTDPTFAGGVFNLDGQSYFLLVNCTLSARPPTVRGGSSAACQFWNCISTPVISLEPTLSMCVWSAGAFISSTDLHNLSFSNCPTLAGSSSLMRMISVDDLSTFFIMLSSTKIRAETHLQVLAGSGFAGEASTTLDSVGGAIVYNDTAAHALNVAALQIQGIGTAYSAKTSGGATLFGTLAVSAANLDAAAGIGTGAGGMLFNPAGGGYLRQGVTP